MFINKAFKVATLGVLGLVGVAGILLYKVQTDHQRSLAERDAKIEAQRQIIGRLGAETRVADIVVTQQERKADGKLHTELLFQEYDRSGKELPPRLVNVVGDVIHVDSKVIKFNQSYVEAGEDLRGKSILLFHKIYGDQTAPADGVMLDAPGKTPLIYRSVDPRVAEFETKLWDNFWTLMTDAAAREKAGVDVAMGDGKWGIFQPDMQYRITIQANGAPILRSSPLPSEIREALKRSRGL
jgi:hypothetical protein